MGEKIPVNQIIEGDCKEVLKTLPDNYIDSIVTDPPYEIGFMGKKWDKQGIAYNILMWKECLRVLKPGGHLLSFGGTRTYHRMVVAIEDAGFEIRDTIGWVYGSGFPKSLNIGKAIDKIQGNKREKIGCEIRYNEPSGIVNVGQGNRKLIKRIITKGFSKWEGWGTALKPAMELICMARKPLSEKNVAENVLKWGTGGINIDKCRIGNEKIIAHYAPKGTFAGGEPRKSETNYYYNQGRFPANLILDGSEEVKKMFPFDKSKRRWRIGYPGGKKFGGGEMKSNVIGVWYGDSGSASRFFKSCPFTEEDIYHIYYCSKAGKKERNMGDVFNGHPAVKPLKLMEYLVLLITPPNGIVLDPFAGSGTTLIAAKKQGFRFIGIELEKEYVEITKKRLSVIPDKLL